MIALRDIKSDFFEFDEEHYKIRGKRTKKEYKLGDPIKIKVKATNLEQRLLDYELIDTSLEEASSDIKKARRKAKIKASIKASKTKKNTKQKTNTHKK